MGYSGSTFSIPCERGGLNASPNKTLMSPELMVMGSKNLNLNKGARQKRGGTAKVNSTAITGSPQIMGIFDFLKPAGSQYIVFATTDGKLWKNTTTTIKIGLTVNKFINMEQFGSKVFFCNQANIPHVWDGGVGDAIALTLIPTDWAGSNYPSQMIRHGRGASERLWAIGCLSTPYTVYASKLDDGADFSDANVTTIGIDTGDGFGIVGAIEFQDNLFCFGRSKTYIIDDADTNISNWGYSAATWEGGVAHHRLIIKTPNDIVCMAEDGDIYSVVTAMQHGDYKRASLTQGTYLHDWIKENLRLSYINNFHGIYNPVERVIKIFVVRSGQTIVDTALVYFLDRPSTEAWMIEDNLNYPSGFNASCAGLIRVGAGDYQIYIGDYSGFIWKLDQSAKNDDGNPYWCGFKTPPLNYTQPRINKRHDRGWLILEPQEAEVLTIDWWLDSIVQPSQTVSAISFVRRYSFPLGNIGDDIELQIYNNTANADFILNEVYLDFLPLGARPGGVDTAVGTVEMGAG